MQIVLLVGYLLVGAVAAPALSQQPPPRQSVVVPTTPQNEAMMRSLEAQRPAFEAYQNCVAEHRREVELHYAADSVIRFRDQRAMLVAAFAQNPQARERYPGGVDQLGASEFARYKSLGGTAGSISDVQPIPSPCPTPGPSLPQHSSPGGQSTITERRSIVVPQK